jgi:DNA replication protein DnaC
MGVETEKKKKVILDRTWLRSSEAAPPVRLEGTLPCALRQAGPCCDGRGYQVTTKGALAQAVICQCVKACPGCFGQARRLDGNDSHSCRIPSPPSVLGLINAAMIPARYAEASLDRFSNYSHQGNGRRVMTEMVRWGQNFKPRGDRGVVIEGPVGSGKTYILAALAKDFAERGLSVRFSDFFQLLGELKAGFSEGKADATQLQPLIDVDVLFIDELGKGRNTDFELTVLDQLVCGRYNQGKTIIASTNYKLEAKRKEYNIPLDRPGGSGFGEFSPDQFENLEQRIGRRIFSRLKEMTTFVELQEDDFRRREGI